MQIHSDVCRYVYTLKDNSTSFIKMGVRSVNMSANEVEREGKKSKIYEVNKIPISIQKYFTTMMKVKIL